MNWDLDKFVFFIKNHVVKDCHFDQLSARFLKEN